MEISKTTVGVLAAICVTAGAGGAYFATRGSVPAPTAVEVQAPVVSPDPAAQTVEQSEAIVTDDTVASPSRTPATPAIERRVTTSRPARSRAPEFLAAPPVQQQVDTVDDQPAPSPRADTGTLAPPALEPARPLEPEPVRAIEPPAPQFEELIVSAESVVGLQVETSVTSERARVEDEVVARVTRDVRVDDRVAIPAGARAHGEVTLVERGGRLRDRARLGIRFTSVVLADGTRVPLKTETIYRVGDAPSGESAAKIGGGAIIGGIRGGVRGAAIGGSAGAGAGTAAVLAGGRNSATLPTGTPITVRVIKPTTVTVEK